MLKRLAVDRCGRAGAARVYEKQVEAVEQLAEDQLPALERGGVGSAGTAGERDDRARDRTGLLVGEQLIRDLELTCAGVGAVEWHGDGAAARPRGARSSTGHTSPNSQRRDHYDQQRVP